MTLTIGCKHNLDHALSNIPNIPTSFCRRSRKKSFSTKMLLQSNDVIARREIGQLLVALCGGLKGKFEIERINAELELVSHYHDTINLISYQQEDDSIWEEITKEGQQLANQLVKELDQVKDSISY
ncbi:hypothetical protein LOAG_18922 [Loa loa]|uniref:Uncharacterized protein n=1 Tax=Loa loa TaxID=7209 RepID=A0A1S0UDL8_LOALO|nr:hypothetical protein LOAG_18922 [Loa loa]EJD73665.1 hypothetical protein LOAG_18922 [Loa loa]